MRITEVEGLSAEEIQANQKAREAQRQADEKQKRAEAEQQYKNKGKSVSPSRDAELKGKGPEIGDDQKTLAQDLADRGTDSDWYKRGVERLTAPYDRDQAIDDAIFGYEGGVKSATDRDKLQPRTPAELPKPKYRKAERFSKTVLNNPNSVLQFDVPGYRTGTVGKPGTIQEKWQQFKTQSVKEKAPPGDKYERMIKDIKKGYAKDGKLTDTERGIAYATAWKLYNKRKGKKS